ncbi:DUF1754-domain-containing protein [Atractiella rhizophila]|nr:DUF1754-domain-containing protein [Atractiella rhizophila]
MSDLVAVGGGLKFKGDAGKKKKKKSKIHQEALSKGDPTAGSSSQASSSKAKEETGSGGEQVEPHQFVRIGKTKAEEHFDETRRKRLEKKMKKQATKSHKDRVAEFNEKLGNLSEHYDIPRVGPG